MNKKTEWMREWVKNNRELHNTRSKESQRKLREKDRESFNKYHKDRYDKDYQKKYRDEHKEYFKNYRPKWVKENWEVAKLHMIRHWAKKQGNGGKHTLKEWKELLEKTNGFCPMCNQKVKMTQDHIIPLSKGGTDNIGNIQPLCRSCNSKKGTKIIKLI